jgi:hypothetical protein
MLTVQIYDDAVTAYPGYDSSREFNVPTKELNEEIWTKERDNSGKISETTPETIVNENSSVNSQVAAKSVLEAPVWMSDRYTRMTSLLLRVETTQFLRLLIADIESTERDTAMFEFLRNSLGKLHTFAGLVTENLISVEDGKFVVTELGVRLITELAGDGSDD